MNILILNWRDIKHPLAGGAEISTHEHAKGWVKRGHHVTFFTSSFPNAKSSEEIDGIHIVRRGSHYTVHLYAWWYYMVQRHEKFDVVVDEFHFAPFFTPFYVKEKKLAFIHETAEEIWFKNTPFPMNVIGYFMEPFFFKIYHHVPFMTVSQSTKNDLEKFGIKDQKIHIIPNGFTQLHNHVRKEKNPVFIYLGRLSEDKGTKEALEAFAFVRKILPTAILWVVGKEERKGYKDRLMKTMRSLNIEEYVRFFGFVPEARKYELLKRAWILIHPSVKEGWGLTVIEAASQGTPTVAYQSAGLSDSIQDRKTGWLVKDRNSRNLGQIIVKLCTNKELYGRMSLAAVNWSNRYNWEKSIVQSLKLIENI